MTRKEAAETCSGVAQELLQGRPLTSIIDDLQEVVEGLEALYEDEGGTNCPWCGSREVDDA